MIISLSGNYKLYINERVITSSSSTKTFGNFKECRKWLFQRSCLNFLSILLTADFKPEQIRIVSFITLTSDRNDSVKILNHWDTFLPDITASFLKNNYAKLLAKSILTARTKCVDSTESDSSNSKQHRELQPLYRTETDSN